MFDTSKLLNISDIAKRIGNFFKLPIQLFWTLSYPELALLEKLSVESKKKALTPFEMIGEYRRNSGNTGYLKFLDWLEASAPYVSHHIKPLSEDEFERLRAQFGSRAITVNIHNIENRKDLRKKYASLYRTLINWCKKD